MLGKLLKNEMKATRRVFLPLFALLLLFAIVGAIFGHSNNYSNQPELLGMLSGLSILLYGMIVFGSIVVTGIFLVQRFYKHLLGDEGYLMFTLPVPAWQHIAAKGLLATFWILISALVGFFSVMIVSRSVGEIPDAIQNGLLSLQESAKQMGIPVILYALEIIGVILVGIMVSLLMVYAAIAIGHLWTEHRLLGAIAGFIGLQIITNTITSIFRSVFIRSTGQYMDWFRGNTAILLMIFGTILLAVVFFFLTNIILKKKLNLE